MYIAALGLWAVFLVAAIFYTRQARNPRTQPLAAYLIFSALFTMTSFAIFAVVIIALNALGRTEFLDRPIAAAVFLLVVFVPAFLVATWQVRKPPHPPELPDP